MDLIRHELQAVRLRDGVLRWDPACAREVKLKRYATRLALLRAFDGYPALFNRLRYSEGHLMARQLVRAGLATVRRAGPFKETSRKAVVLSRWAAGTDEDEERPTPSGPAWLDEEGLKLLGLASALCTACRLSLEGVCLLVLVADSLLLEASLRLVKAVLLTEQLSLAERTSWPP